MDTTFKTEVGKFNYRVMSVITNKECDRFLLYSAEDIDFWVTFGGRCKMGELSLNSLHRELEEELGEVKTVYNKLIGSSENIFTENGKIFHELSFIYHIILDDDEDLLQQTGINSTIEDNNHIQKWFNLDEIASNKIFPLFFVELAHNINKEKQSLAMQHYVTNDID